MDEKQEIYSGPLHISFALQAEDVKAALSLSGRLPNRVGLHIFQSILAGLAFVVFVSSVIANPANALNYFLSFLCLLLLAVIWIYPAMTRQKAVKKTVDGRIIEIEIDEENLHVRVPQSGQENTISLSSLPPVKKNDAIYLLELPEGSMLVIPVRALPAGSKAAMDEMLRKTGAQKDVLSA